MPSLPLHPVQRKSRTLYWVDQFPLYLLDERSGWHIYTPISCKPVQNWLCELGLLAQFFRTRSDALSVLELALDHEGAPQPDPMPALKRSEDGYAADERFSLTRRGGVWTITDKQSRLTSMIQGSLWQTTWVVLYHQLRVEWAEELKRVRPMSGYTLSEISRQRLVMEGADRPSLANDMLGLRKA